MLETASITEQRETSVQNSSMMTTAERVKARTADDRETIARIEEAIPRLRRFARAMVRDGVLADDLVQDCLERAIGRLHLWQPGTNLNAWLFTILRNLYVNSVRRQRPTLDIDDPAAADIGSHVGTQMDRVLVRDMKRGLETLTPDQREVLLLVGLEGMAYADAAKLLKVSIGTVKSRLSRARSALKAYMEGDG